MKLFSPARIATANASGLGTCPTLLALAKKAQKKNKKP